MKFRLLVLLVYTGIYATSFSQSIQEQMTKQQPDCNTVLINASSATVRVPTYRNDQLVVTPNTITQRMGKRVGGDTNQNSSPQGLCFSDPAARIHQLFSQVHPDSYQPVLSN